MSPTSKSLNISNTHSKKNRTSKSIVKKEIERISRLVEDFSSTKFLNECLNDKHPKKSAEKKKCSKNYNEENFITLKNSTANINANNLTRSSNEIASNLMKIHRPENLRLCNNNNNNIKNNNKQEQKNINGRNIALIRQKANNANTLKSNNNFNNQGYLKTDNSVNVKSNKVNAKFASNNKNSFSGVKSRSKSKPKFITNEREFFGNDNSFVTGNDNMNNNRFIRQNSNNISNLSNLNSSYDAASNINNNNNNNIQLNKNYQQNFMTSNNSNIFSNASIYKDK